LARLGSRCGPSNCPGSSVVSMLIAHLAGCSSSLDRRRSPQTRRPWLHRHSRTRPVPRLCGRRERLAHAEECLQPLPFDLGQVSDGPDRVIGRADGRNRDRDDLVILLSTVDHFEDADGPDADHHAWNDGLARVDEPVERIAVAVKRAGDRAAICRRGPRHRLESIHDDVADFGVNFILSISSLLKLPAGISITA
jgi:hypothetical protein